MSVVIIIIMAIVKSMHVYLTYVSMRHTLANTAELSVEFGIITWHALHFLLLQTELRNKLILDLEGILIYVNHITCAYT